MSVKGIQNLRARFLQDYKIDNKEVKSLIKEAEDGFMFFKHVSTSEREELVDLLEKHQDKFEPGARDKLASFLGLRMPTVTSDDLAAAFAKLENSMEAARDSTGQVNLEQVAGLVRGDSAAEAALDVIRRAFATTQPVTVSTGCGTTTEMRDVAPTSIGGERARSVFDALVGAKQEVSSLDSDGDRILSKAERDQADRLSGLSGRMVKAAVDEAEKPQPVGSSC